MSPPYYCHIHLSKAQIRADHSSVKQINRNFALAALSNKLGNSSSLRVQALHNRFSKLLPLFIHRPHVSVKFDLFLSISHLSQPSCHFFLLEFLPAIHLFELHVMWISVKSNCNHRTSSNWSYPI